MSARERGAVLELDAVVKHYQGFGGEVVRAVDGLSLTIGPGEIVAPARSQRLRVRARC